MKISVIGLGYVGLPLACAIAKKTGHQVVGYDLSQSKIQKIQDGICPIDDFQCEEDLKVVKFETSTDDSIIEGSDVYIVCVPTPVLDDYTPDLTPVKSATATIARHLKKGNYVVIESTVNPGVSNEVVIPILQDATGLICGVDFDVAHCPERINPGDPKWNVYNIPRNIGASRIEAANFLADLYRSFIDATINVMKNLKTAEATKIIENTFRDINIAFVNELAKSFDVLGIDLMEVIRGASNKPFAFLAHYPSCGVGGHCIPVDPYYLIERAKQSGFDHKFLKLAREINNSMPEYTIQILTEALNEFEKSVKNTKIGLLGMSYKANVGDLRESPSLEIKKLLEERGADVLVFDQYFPELSNCNSLDEVLNTAFAVIIATDHTQFKAISAEQLQGSNVKVVIDGKNCLDKKRIKEAGIYYKGIGT